MLMLSASIFSNVKFTRQKNKKGATTTVSALLWIIAIMLTRDWYRYNFKVESIYD